MAVLRKYQHMSILEQKHNKQKIFEAFTDLWDATPSIEEFVNYAEGLVLTPEMLYYMAKQTLRRN